MGIGLVYARRIRRRRRADSSGGAYYDRAPRYSGSSVGTTTGFGTLQTPAQLLDPWANLAMVNDGDANAFAAATMSRNPLGLGQQQMEVI